MANTVPFLNAEESRSGEERFGKKKKKCKRGKTAVPLFSAFSVFLLPEELRLGVASVHVALR